MFQLDLKSRKSIYEQVVDNLKELIITGVINPEDKLPSVRDLSKQLTVNPNTIQKAYRSLEVQGYIYTVTGLGTFALRPAENKIDERMVLTIKEKIRSEIKELLYLGVSFSDAQKILEDLMLERGGWK